MPSADMEVDLSPTLDSELPKLRDMALKEGRLADALEKMLALEKQARLGNDIPSTSRMTAEIVSLCHEAGEWGELNSHLLLLAKRRGQLKQATTAMVQKAMTFIDSCPTQEAKYEFLGTLRTITSGKIYVEVERASLTRTVAAMKEAEGKIDEASKIIQEVAVETFGAMSKHEKADFILEQMRLCLDSKDFIRAKILSNKLTNKTLADDDFQDIKIRFHTLLIRYFAHEKDFLEICRAHWAMFATKIVQEKEEDWQFHLKRAVVYVALSPYDAEQADLIQRINAEKKLAELPTFKALLKNFLTTEIFRWPDVQARFQAEFGDLLEGELMETLHLRVTEHNIRVVAQYYTRVSMNRLASLLDLPADETEARLSDMVTTNKAYARIDRPNGVINFVRPKDASDRLNAWSRDTSSLLELVDKTSHLVQIEIQNAAGKAKLNK